MNRWIFSSGLRREQPKARRPKATVKLRLEELEDRALPSVTAGIVPQNEIMTSQMASMWQQWSPMIVALQQDYFAGLQMLGQEYAQAVSYAQYEVAQFLDVFMPTFGSGDTTTNTVSNQQPQPVTPPSGNGSMTSANNSAKPPTAKPLANGGPQVYFETSGTQIPESTGCMTNVTLGVFLSGPSTQTVSVYATTSDGSATQGIDYTAENEEVIFQPGQTVQTVSIPILDDGDDEDAGNSQYFDVTLNNPNGATLGNTSSCQVTIVENPQQGADDTLVWNPCPGSDDDASDSANWYDQTLQMQLTKGQPGPGPGTPIIFDGTPTSQTPDDDSPIDWDDPKVPSWTLENGFNKQQTINSGDAIELTGKNGTSLSMDGTSDLNLKFTDGTSKFQIDANATITNMHLGGSAAGQFLINGGTTWIAGNPGAGKPGYAELDGVSVVVGPSATLIDLGYNPLKFWASNINIKVQGDMVVYYGPNATNTQIDINGNSKDYIDVTNVGVLEYIGTAGVKDTFTVPVLVEVDAQFQVSGGYLIVQNVVPGQANNASVYLNGANAWVQLSNSATLECDNDYYQAQGALATMDTTDCTLQDGPNNQLGTATIAGGGLYIAHTGKATDYGTFFIDCKQLNFGANFNAKIEGDSQGAGTNDILSINSGTGTINLQGSSSLSVLVANQPQMGQKLSWPIIYAGTFINNQFNTEASIPNTPGLTYGPAQATKYSVTYGM